jgi:hypothetical protein
MSIKTAAASLLALTSGKPVTKLGKKITFGLLFKGPGIRGVGWVGGVAQKVATFWATFFLKHFFYIFTLIINLKAWYVVFIFTFKLSFM